MFDLDGLLVDSEGAWGRAEQEMVAARGRAWDERVRALLFGRGPDDVARTLADWLGEPDWRSVGEELRARALEVFREGLEPQPGAARLVAALHGRLPLGVATNSTRALAETALAGSGLARLVDTLVTPDEVDNPKPAGDVYAEACRRLGTDPTRSVALEDSAVGTVAAKAAGLWTVLVPSFEGVGTDGADAVLSSLEEVDPEAMLAGPARDGAGRQVRG